MRIDLFRMERFQSLYWNEVEFDLSESGVMPLSVDELLEGDPRGADARAHGPPVSRAGEVRVGGADAGADGPPSKRAGAGDHQHDWPEAAADSGR